MHDTSLRRFWILTLFSAVGIAGTAYWGGTRHLIHANEALADSASPSDANIFVALAKKIVPSVVNISTLSTVKGGDYGGGPNNPDDLFRKFFDDFFRHHGNAGPRGGGGDDDSGGDDGGGGGAPTPAPSGKLPKAMSLGTGFIIDASGLILTNNHVVADADEIKISFTEDEDEKLTDGEVVGRDPELDVALIHVKTKRELTAVTLGDSDASEVGEYVIAVGNPFGQGHSVTHGIICAKGRLAPDFPLARYLQTDAPINPGNSGGPLVNLKGEVIGINNAIDQRAQGIGFAIPINAGEENSAAAAYQRHRFARLHRRARQRAHAGDRGEDRRAQGDASAVRHPRLSGRASRQGGAEAVRRDHRIQRQADPHVLRARDGRDLGRRRRVRADQSSSQRKREGPLDHGRAAARRRALAEARARRKRASNRRASIPACRSTR